MVNQLLASVNQQKLKKLVNSVERRNPSQEHRNHFSYNFKKSKSEINKHPKNNKKAFSF